MRARPPELDKRWSCVYLAGSFALASTVGLVVALFFGEQFAALVLPPDLLQFAPVAAARGVLTADGLLIPFVALAYLAAALVASSLLIERAEIA